MPTVIKPVFKPCADFVSEVITPTATAQLLAG